MWQVCWAIAAAYQICTYPIYGREAAELVASRPMTFFNLYQDYPHPPQIIRIEPR
jgi:hypothetical protein